MRAEEAIQISAFLANKPGSVADVSDELHKLGVNIRALTVLDSVDVATLRLLVDNVEAAKAALLQAGAAYVENRVVVIAIPNASGAFGTVARTLAQAGVNIEYVYATAQCGTDSSLGVFRVSDTDKALEIEFAFDAEPVVA